MSEQSKKQKDDQATLRDEQAKLALSNIYSINDGVLLAHLNRVSIL